MFEDVSWITDACMEYYIKRKKKLSGIEEMAA